MIVLCAGMQRSGSRWYFDLIHDLMVANGCPASLDVREKYGLSFLGQPRCNLHRAYFWRMWRLDRISRSGLTFMIKTHSRPSPSVRRLMAMGRLKATYIYRDPRDVIVSAMERGRLMRESGEARRLLGLWPYRDFARLYTVPGALFWARWQLLTRWESWMRCEGLLVMRYEDLRADPRRQLARVAEFLDLDAPQELVDRIVAGYEPDRWREKPRAFNKGVTGRYKEVFSDQEQELSRKRLGYFLKRMGYAE